MKIEQIQIHNVRCINDMTLKLDDYLPKIPEICLHKNPFDLAQSLSR